MLKYRVKDKFTDIICSNINSMSLQMDTSKELWIGHLLPVFFNNSIYGFGIFFSQQSTLYNLVWSNVENSGAVTGQETW